MIRCLCGLVSAALLGLVASGCIPYAVGTTAETLSPGELSESVAFYFVPVGNESLADQVSKSSDAYLAIDLEGRIGITERSDLGIRIPGLSGLVVNYKHRLTAAGNSTALALMGGVGMVNAGDHAHMEMTFLASAVDHQTHTPYGGLRGMQVFPLSEYAVNDSPTLGGFFGVRIGDADRGITPELALYYDRSALGLREANFILVPSLTMHGRLFTALFRRR